jgi:hypothetical protein
MKGKKLNNRYVEKMERARTAREWSSQVPVGERWKPTSDGRLVELCFPDRVKRVMTFREGSRRG